MNPSSDYNGAMSEPQKHPDAYPLNAPGDFYVVNGGCMACGAPKQEAPELIVHDDSAYNHCYFRRQPTTPEETESACRAVELGCCGSVRYGGRDESILKRLDKWGRDRCDYVDLK
jgi:hypothetical protein